MAACLVAIAVAACLVAIAAETRENAVAAVLLAVYLAVLVVFLQRSTEIRLSAVSPEQAVAAQEALSPVEAVSPVEVVSPVDAVPPVVELERPTWRHRSW